MALILNIDTATEVASICITADGEVLAYAENRELREHASFLHTSIDRIARESRLELRAMDAFSVTSGPGSYTGLRVGMAAAKGFCYAFGKPMIAVNTLEVMAKAGLDAYAEEREALFCPMIDARRMEVFAGIYDQELQAVMQPGPVVLEADSFCSYMKERKIFFFGSGSTKFSTLVNSSNAVFSQVGYSAKNLAQLAEMAFKKGDFADTTYSQPNYFKDFQTTVKS